MGYKDRSAIFELKNSLQTEPPFHYYCMVVCEGQVIGTWNRIIEKKQIELQYDLFTQLKGDQPKEFEKAIQRFSAFNNLPVEYTPPGYL